MIKYIGTCARLDSEMDYPSFLWTLGLPVLHKLPLELNIQGGIQ